ncbi:unnamed protein product [Diamesa hyperborea]
MTHQNQTNGASLEDCHTNFFALADLCGIKWKKLVLNERPNASGDPLDDPVLNSYTKCLAKDILCVWRRVSQHKNDLDTTGGLGGMFDISQSGNCSSVIHPPLSLTAAKELWIFWYGEEPDLSDLVSPDLLKSSDNGEQGSWESGLSYECRSLLFKALHNLIERCLLSRDIVRLGKWFVQPTTEQNVGKSSVHLSFSFAFFVHGESTVCASMDIREHPPVRPLNVEYLNKALQQQTQMQQNLENDKLFGNEGINNNSTIEEADNGESSQSNGCLNLQPVTVILAPFGLSATLTGNSSQNLERQQTEKILNDWSAFYPLSFLKPSDDEEDEKNAKNVQDDLKIPQIVEIIAGGVKMHYPSKYVLITDVDSKIINLTKPSNCNQLFNSESVYNSIYSGSNSRNISTNNEVNARQNDNGSMPSVIKSSKFSPPLSANAASVLPERVWQDLLMNTAYTNSSSLSSSAAISGSGRDNSKSDVKIENINDNLLNAANVDAERKGTSSSCLSPAIWDYSEPVHKTSCSCIKCKKIGTNPRTSSSFASTSNVQSSSSSSSSSSTSSKSRLSRVRTPFHKRTSQTQHQLILQKNSKDLKSFNSTPSIKDTKDQQSHSTGSNPDIRFLMSPNQRSVSSLQPPTPSLENLDQKPNVQILTTASSTGLQDENIKLSPRASTSNADQNSQTQLETKKHISDNNVQLQLKINLLKRPALSSRDYENMHDDDYVPHQSLYDYSTWDAWMNHPIKRFKPDEFDKYKINKNYKDDLYYGQECTQSSTLPFILNQRPSSNGSSWGPFDDSDVSNKYKMKEKMNDSDAEKNSNNDNLFTSEGLQPSYADLNKIFDNSDDNSNDEHIEVNTPPGSNNSVSGSHVESDLTELELKRIGSKMTLNNFTNIASNISSSCSSSNVAGNIRNEELSKMFPTPPSIEQHTNSSPGGVCGNVSDSLIEMVEPTLPTTKQENYHNLGSPHEDTIEDWSYVFIPPKMSSFVGSSKYAPLMNLSSQILPPVPLPPNSTYKPSWVKQKEQEELQKKDAIVTEQEKTKQSIHNNKENHQNLNERSLIRSVAIKQETHLHSQLSNDYSRTNSTTPTLPNRGPPLGVPGMKPGAPSIMTKLLTQGSNTILNNNIYGMPISSPNMMMNRNMQQQKIPEANSLLVNILLYDSSLNIFRDHNFDSCTLCVCNAGPKCVGNIRGSDSGIYLSLSASCHFNENANTQQHQNGYVDDDPIQCNCGFSAVVNRRLAHKTGLFYEDEMEITGMAVDPACHKKPSLLSIIFNLNGTSMEKIRQQQSNKMPKIKEEPNCGGDESMSSDNHTKNTMAFVFKGTEEISTTNLPTAIMDLLREQCTLIQNSSNSIQRAIKHFNQAKSVPEAPTKQINILEFIDAYDIITLAIEQSRFIFDRFDGYNNRLQPYMQQKPVQKKSSAQQQTVLCVHKWGYLHAAGPKSNQDIIRVMKSMQTLLQNAFNQNGTTGLWDAPYAVKGPLTWREFHRLAGRGIGQCEPQPIPSVIVGHDKDWLCVSPYALQFWDKLLLEPYSYPRDIAYIVVAPDNEYVTNRVKTFFKELSTTYEMCRLGRHQPIKGWDGILRVGKNKSSFTDNVMMEDWFQSLGNGKLNELIRLYGQVLQNHLVPYLSKIPNDKSLLDPPESYSSSIKDSQKIASSLPSPMLPPHTPESSSSSSMQSGNNNQLGGSCDKAPITPKAEPEPETRENLNNSTSNPADSLSQQPAPPANPPHIVLYLVEPFTSGTDSTDLERVACLALLKYYSNILNAVPESIRTNISLQIISQESVLELGRNRDINRWSDHMRSLALNVFSQSRRYLTHGNNIKSLTGFGTAANAEVFMKTKDEKNKQPYKLLAPPYILSTRHAKSENAENFGQTSIEQQTGIMYCSYCLSEDQSMLLAVVTDERGEFLENCTINIDVPNRCRRKKVSARRIGLQKLMDFILGVMSQSVKPWRLVIGRIGRIGHGELKGWSWLLSKSNLVKASKYLKDICQQCSVMYPHAVPSIWSACLVTLEPDSNFRVMPDQFTPDERFSQRSMQSPLSTPQDVTCTHILVFPISAILQSSQTAFQEQNHDLEFENEIFQLDDTDDVGDVADINGIQDLFDQWNESAVGIPASPTRDSHRGSPTGMDDNRSRQSPGISDVQSGQSRNHFNNQDTEEVGQLLQQPLALGYLVSTAPTGRMPAWFWSSCPHLEHVCPVFLKTSLHIHSPSIHKENDDIYMREQSSKPNIEHPLDSNTTADVLRYVLEGYNVLSWLAMDANSHDRLSCLPIHVQMLMQLYQLHTALA